MSTRDLLARLAAEHPELLTGIARAEYVLWLGSGISMGRAESVRDFLQRALDFLHAKIEIEGEQGAHAEALREIIDLAGPAFEDLKLGIGSPPDQWVELDSLLDALWSRYSEVLDVPVSGQLPDYLLWDAIGVVRGYAGPVDPDSEHLLLAVLAAEACIPSMVSANWDGLIEIAFKECSGSASSALDVVVRPEDLRPRSGRSGLYKFHGCAVLAGVLPDEYRNLLISRASQIESYIVAHAHQDIRDALISFARDKRTLMVGLSAQDTDIKQIFAAAADRRPWRWPEDSGSVLFGTSSLSSGHDQILRNIYGSAFTAHSTSIRETAGLRSRAKALFAALLVHVWYSKWQTYVGLLSGPDALLNDLALGLVAWRESLSRVLDDPSLTKVRAVLGDFSSSLGAFRFGPDEPVSATYRPISSLPAHQVELNPDEARLSRSPELAAALALLELGASVGRWELDDNPALLNKRTMTTPSGQTRAVQIFSTDGAFAQAQVSGHVLDPASDAITLVGVRAPVQTRNPSSRVGRGSGSTQMIIDLGELLSSAINGDDLVNMFGDGALL